MSRRTMQPGAPDNCQGLTSVRAPPLSLGSELIDIKNRNDLPFNMAGWNDWIRWEGYEIEQNAARYIQIPDQKVSSANTFSSLNETWISSHQTNGTESTSEPYSSAVEFPFGDTVFYGLLDIPLGLEADPVLAEGLKQTTIFQDVTQDERGSLQSFPSLTEAGEFSLQDTTMSGHENQYVSPKPTSQAEAPSPILSPVTSLPSPSPSLKPPLKVTLRKTRKRKAAAYDEGNGRKLLSQSRKGHNAIEKRYRTNLNEKIDCLRQGIPSLSSSSNMSKSQDDDEYDETTETTETELSNVGATAQQQKTGKAAVLTRALEYIQDLEKSEIDSGAERGRLHVEIAGLRLRIVAFENLVTSGNALIANDQESTETSESRFLYLLKPED